MSLTSSFLSYILLLSMVSCGMEYPFGQLASAAVAVSLSNVFLHPKPTQWWVSVKSKEGLASTIDQVLKPVCYQHASSLKSQTQPLMNYCEEI